MERGKWFIAFDVPDEIDGCSYERHEEIPLSATTEREAIREARKIADSGMGVDTSVSVRREFYGKEKETVPPQYAVIYKIPQENSDLEATFAAVFRAQDEGRLQWKIIEDETMSQWVGKKVPDRLVSEVAFKNSRGEEMTIKATLFTSKVDATIEERWLYLGDGENLEPSDPRVRRLLSQLAKSTQSQQTTT